MSATEGTGGGRTGESTGGGVGTGGNAEGGVGTRGSTGGTGGSTGGTGGEFSSDHLMNLLKGLKNELELLRADNKALREQVEHPFRRDRSTTLSGRPFGIAEVKDEGKPMLGKRFESSRKVRVIEKVSRSREGFLE